MVQYRCARVEAAARACGSALVLLFGMQSSRAMAHVHLLECPNLTGAARKWCGVVGDGNHRVPAVIKWSTSPASPGGSISLELTGCRLLPDAQRPRPTVSLGFRSGVWIATPNQFGVSLAQVSREFDSGFTRTRQKRKHLPKTLLKKLFAETR